jgi:trimeric autotransporter adhesin
LRFNTTGQSNTAYGHQALYKNTTGANNTAVGIFSSEKGTTGVGNAVLGYAALYENTTGGSNTAIGREAGRFIADGETANTSTSNSVFLGYNTKALATGQTNQIVIGDTAVGLGSNTAILVIVLLQKLNYKATSGLGRLVLIVFYTLMGQELILEQE